MEARLDGAQVIGTSSGTDALVLALLAFGVRAHPLQPDLADRLLLQPLKSGLRKTAIFSGNVQ